jgi:UDP-N-acetylglucosamine 2-epimerase (non-hydrolysing)
MPREVAVVFGTRPEATKLAPLHLCLDEAAEWEPTLVYTGQHGSHVYDALEPFDLKPDLTFELDRDGGLLVELNARLLAMLGPVLDPDRFDAVIVQGDTATTLAAALVAYWNRIPIVHLEAGLRTGDLYAPWPEEGNRRLVSPLADLHLAPTDAARANLLREDVSDDRVAVVGNTSIDAVLHTAAQSHRFDSIVPSGYRRHVLVTAHRRESWGAGIRAIGDAVGRLSVDNPDTAFLVAVHPNPAVRADLTAGMGVRPNAVCLPPLPYGQFVRAMADAYLVLTDSGGVQEEAPALDVPVLVLRDVTERPEGVEAGCAELVGTDADHIVAAAQRLLDDGRRRELMALAPCPYGGGRAAQACVAALEARSAAWA